MKTIVIILTIVACAALENEELYTTLVRMTQNQIGHDENTCRQDELLNYLREAFGFDENIHQKALENARNMEAPKVHLAVKIVKAEELFGKDSNGQSDPFCIIYLKSTNEKLYQTEVQNKTIAPVWEEQFEREFEYVENDALRLEVRDFDPIETCSEIWSKRGEAKGMRGMFKLCRELAVAGRRANNTAEFIGSSEIPLEDIAVIGETKWFELRKKKRSGSRGMVQLQLAFASSDNPQEVLEEYRELLGILLSHATKTEKIEDYCWSGISAPAARAIDLQYRAQKGLCSRNVALSQWIVYCKMNKEYPLHFTVFENLARKLLRQSVDLVLPSAEHTLFWEGARNVLHACFTFIKDIDKLRECNETESPQLKRILGIISRFSRVKVSEEFNLFPRTMYDWLPQQDNTEMALPQVLKYTVEEGIAEWWDLLPSENVTETNTEQAAIDYRIYITNLAIEKLRKAVEIDRKAFIKYVDLPYAKTAFVAHGKRLSDLCMETIKNACLKLEPLDDDNEPNDIVLGETLYTLYQNLKRIVQYGQGLGINGTSNMTILDYHEWFERCATYWLDLSRLKALQRIDEAIKHDSLSSAVASDYSRISSSAVDIFGIFNQMVIFWDRFAWPDIPEALTFLEIIIKDACDSSIVFASKLLAKVEKMAPQSDKKGVDSTGADEETFQVSRKWCFAVNNIEHVQTSIGPWAPREFLDAEGPGADEFRQSLATLIEVTIGELERKIGESFEVVGNEAAKSIVKCIMLIAKSSDLDASRNAMIRLENYLWDNITILRDSLSGNNFSKIAMIIWHRLLQMLHQQIDENLKKNRPTSFYSELLHTVQYLDRGFRDLGIDENSENDKMHEKIERLLKFNAMETTDLIRLYNIERIEEQNNLTERIEGTLYVLPQFKSNSLNILIVLAQELRKMDKDGFSDPYVKIKLLPKEKFPNIGKIETAAVSNTLKPHFDETFDIPLSSEQRNSEDAILVFEVWDQELCGFNRFMAEAFVRLSEIPEYGVDQLKTLDLKLSRPSNETTIVVETLANRKKDEKAKKFTMSRQKKLKSIKS